PGARAQAAPDGAAAEACRGRTGGRVAARGHRARLRSRRTSTNGQRPSAGAPETRASFEYHEPTSLAEAVALGARCGDDGRFLAGGTDLIIQMHRGKLRPRHVVSLHRVSGLDAIDANGAVRLGALVTHRALERFPAFQGRLRALVEGAEVVGGHQVRNVGTVGGNIVNASPAADVARARGGALPRAARADRRDAAGGGPTRHRRLPANQRRARVRPLPSPPRGDAGPACSRALRGARPGAGVVSKLALTLTINGERHEILTEPHRTLLDVLRADLGLTGTKENCLEAECGVCTILLDGAAVNACILLAAQCQGRAVLTIEGLARNGDLHPLQRAFIDHGAVQCGYCIPGMILSAQAYLEEHPSPTEYDVR